MKVYHPGLSNIYGGKGQRIITTEEMAMDLAEAYREVEKGWTANISNYGNLAKSFGKAADCIACGQCEGVCPQHLPIIDLMKKVSAHFDH